MEEKAGTSVQLSEANADTCTSASKRLSLYHPPQVTDFGTLGDLTRATKKIAGPLDNGPGRPASVSP